MKMAFMSCLLLLLFSTAQVNARDSLNLFSLPGEKRVSIVDALAQDSICESCLKVARKADKTLRNPKLFKGVTSLSNEVCHVLPSDLNTKCLETSKGYIDQSRLFLQELFHEKNLCNSTGLCVANASVSSSPTAMKLMDSKSCTTCRSSVKQVLQKLKLTEIRNKLMTALHEYCEEAEDNEQQCKDVVDRYAPSVLKKVETMKPSDLCRLVGFCDEGISL